MTRSRSVWVSSWYRIYTYFIVVFLLLIENCCLHIGIICLFLFFFFSSRRRHTRSDRDWSSDVCSSDLYTFLENHLEHLCNDLNGTSPASDLPPVILNECSIYGILDNPDLSPIVLSFFQIGRASCRERV